LRGAHTEASPPAECCSGRHCAGTMQHMPPVPPGAIVYSLGRHA
jgi:hypothetical protein